MTERYTDLSIDLETLGTHPDAVITQIGLCPFNADTGETGLPIKLAVDPQSCLDLGMTVTWPTISWWMQQNDKARLGMAQQAGVTLSGALRATSAYITTQMNPGFCPWGFGATFDVSLMENAYRRCKMEVPWGFREVRDLRTLSKLRPCTYVARPVPEVEHDAGYDALAQAHYVIECMKVI